ncbi:amino acid ABC transporter permease [Rhodococcus sp. USK10]|uniref:amino acid ABC transporter permease n=1 Tax=Rhodococcus sp. USK10 TaxID=2789739 RepID=UPI001C5CEC56|nr:amino acid ABC transporter permease [Rhodococcus sp. USK10]QYB01864.1 amino acid ABC transporter permease [Rhodococcus sp. USK10]
MSAFQFDWTAAQGALPFMLDGLIATIEITVLTVSISMVLAVPVAVARMSEVRPVRWIAQAYIELFRCTPLLVQLFWIFYGLPILTGGSFSGFTSALVALTANLTAFMAEAYRSGFQNVPVEQIEAGRMLQLTSVQRLRHIIVPQALRQQLPVILSLNISTFKDTALVSTIAVADLMFVANTQATLTYRPVEILTLAAAMYFTIAFPISLIASTIERKMRTVAPPRRRNMLTLERKGTFA